jgi:hypothetical protein
MELLTNILLVIDSHPYYLSVMLGGTTWGCPTRKSALHQTPDFSLIEEEEIAQEFGRES